MTARPISVLEVEGLQAEFHPDVQLVSIGSKAVIRLHCLWHSGFFLSFAQIKSGKGCPACEKEAAAAAAKHAKDSEAARLAKLKAQGIARREFSMGSPVDEQPRQEREPPARRPQLRDENGKRITYKARLLDEIRQRRLALEDMGRNQPTDVVV